MDLNHSFRILRFNSACLIILPRSSCGNSWAYSIAFLQLIIQSKASSIVFRISQDCDHGNLNQIGRTRIAIVCKLTLRLFALFLVVLHIRQFLFALAAQAVASTHHKPEYNQYYIRCSYYCPFFGGAHFAVLGEEVYIHSCGVCEQQAHHKVVFLYSFHICLLYVGQRYDNFYRWQFFFFSVSHWQNKKYV